MTVSAPAPSASSYGATCTRRSSASPTTVSPWSTPASVPPSPTQCFAQASTSPPACNPLTIRPAYAATTAGSSE